MYHHILLLSKIIHWCLQIFRQKALRLEESRESPPDPSKVESSFMGGLEYEMEA